LRFLVTRDVEEFAGHAEAFLAARIERNVMATILVRARSGRFAAPDRLFAVAPGEAAALRIPPWPLLCTALDPAAADALLGVWLPEDPRLSAVNADRDTARAIAAAWTRRTGGQATCRLREAMHTCEEVVDPPRPAPGHLRAAGPAERDLLVAWERAFTLEAGVEGGGNPGATVDDRLADGSQHVWVHAEPVATLGVSPTIAGVARIGPVYTPPHQRRRGYASSAVAAAARTILARDASRCMLFTDLANPTSNKIYAAVGFRRQGDWEEHTLIPATTPADRPAPPRAAR
jgi:RimJ/RimL family protein N-acetyltransferase